MIGNLLKAAIGVAISPAAVAIDVITIPISSSDPDPRVGPFDRSAKVFGSIGDNIKKAIDP